MLAAVARSAAIQNPIHAPICRWKNTESQKYAEGHSSNPGEGVCRCGGAKDGHQGQSQDRGLAKFILLNLNQVRFCSEQSVQRVLHLPHVRIECIFRSFILSPPLPMAVLHFTGGGAQNQALLRRCTGLLLFVLALCVPGVYW